MTGTPLLPPAPAAIALARADLAAHLQVVPEAAPTVRAILRALDTLRDCMRSGRLPGNSAALGCSRAATLLSEAAVLAWPGFRERV